MKVRLVFNYNTNTLDLRRQRVTDIKDCPKLILPPSRPGNEEMELHNKETLWNNRYKLYRENKCNEKGFIKVDNMTKSERRGQRKLGKRKSTGQIVISSTDKSSEITISSREAYKIQGSVHVSKDKLSSWAEVRKAKAEAISHVKALNHIFNSGQEIGESNQTRLREANNEDRTVIPNVILLHKNQKSLDPKTNQPATRPVCLARTMFIQRANDYLCTFLGAPMKLETTSEAQ